MKDMKYIELIVLTFLLLVWKVVSCDNWLAKVWWDFNQELSTIFLPEVVLQSVEKDELNL